MKQNCENCAFQCASWVNCDHINKENCAMWEANNFFTEVCSSYKNDKFSIPEKYIGKHIKKNPSELATYINGSLLFAATEKERTFLG